MSPGPLTLALALGPFPLPLTVAALSKESFRYCPEARFHVSRSPEIHNSSLGTNSLFAEESQGLPELLSGWTCWCFRCSAGRM